ncbi:MAG: hypothetical protein HY840_06025 [Bacteroidetes bacterium]|nr:hypothetical protein [Bacteroidota bacterium]
MYRIKNTSLIIFLVLGIGSCKKDKNSPALLFVYPETSTINLTPHQIFTFTIDGSSDAAPLNRFMIRSKIPLQSYTLLLDSSLSTKKFSLQFEYQAPSFPQSTSITMEFILTDQDGNETKIARGIHVASSGSTLIETAGHELYSSLSGKEDAYDLAKGLPIFSKTASISSQHLRDSTVTDTNKTYLLSKKWFSPAGLKFVRFVDFDYANATSVTLKQSYEAGVKKDFLSNIAVDDVILTRFPSNNPDSGYVAIKLIYVIDADSCDFDRYIFNIKK